MKTVYTIWSEDECSWAQENGVVWLTKEAAQKALNEHVEENELEGWIEDGLIHLIELRVMG